MATQHYVNKSAALRILKEIAIEILSVRLSRNTVQVTYRTKHGKCSTFLSLKAFKRDFVEFRLNGAKSAKIKQVFPGKLNHVWDVLCEGSSFWKEVRKMPSGKLMCSCQDYASNKEVCKHTIAVWERVYKFTLAV